MELDEGNYLDKVCHELVKIERKCFYGEEIERDRLKKLREAIDRYMQEPKDDN